MSPTVTPVPVPETGLGPDGGRLVAPGVSTAGVFDAGTLASAHESALDAVRYRLVRTQTVRLANASEANESATLNAITRQVTATPGPDAYAFSKVESARRAWYVSEPYSRVDVWYRGDIVRNRFVDADRTERFWGTDRAQPGGPIRNPTSRNVAADDLAAVDLRVVAEETVDGVTVTHLRGRGLTDVDRLALPPLVADPRNVSLVARVDESGVVRSYTLTFDATFSGDGRTLRVRREHRVSSLGEATVERPDWLPAANESVSNR
jgi:hypothetical protein